MKNELTNISLAIVSVFTFAGYTVAQNNHTPALHQYLKHIDYLTEDGGKWKTRNTDYKPTEEWSAEYYGYEFKKGINPNTLLLKITGYVPKKSQWMVYWDGFYTWDYKKQKGVYYSVNSGGAVAAGESEYINADEMALVFTVTSPDGKIEKHKDIEKFGDDKILSKSFKFIYNKWQADNSFDWTRLKQPKGTLSFVTTRDGNFEVYTMNAEGKEEFNLSKNLKLDFGSSWSPDGKYVYFYSKRDDNDEVYRMDADGKNPVNLSNHPASDNLPCISHDGKKIVYTSDRDSKNKQIFVMNADGSNVVKLTDYDLHQESPSWSPDDKQILFTRQIRDAGDTSHSANGEIFIMDADGKNVKRLTHKKGYDSGTEYSPDGEKIAFYGPTEEGNFEIFLMNADGTDLTNLTEDEMEDYSPSWSPDGKWIAYTKGNSKNYDVWIIHLETKIKTCLTDHPKRDESPVWKPVKQ